ncbi:MAG: hypothetical protein NTX53_21905, partial [candidate division WOR-3 bacterium]|nr:hypothetical protein [candidate division WOR-3 bacterium]
PFVPEPALLVSTVAQPHEAEGVRCAHGVEESLPRPQAVSCKRSAVIIVSTSSTILLHRGTRPD